MTDGFVVYGGPFPWGVQKGELVVCCAEFCYALSSVVVSDAGAVWWGSAYYVMKVVGLSLGCQFV